MAVTDFQMMQAWRQVLTLSKVKAGDAVSILTGENTHPQTLRTAHMALEEMEAVVTQVHLRPVNGEKSLSRDLVAYLGETALTNNPPAIAALKSSDLVLDLMTLLFSPEQLEILKSGTKILLAVEPPEVLCRMVPTMEDKIRVSKATERLSKAQTMRVTSASGTDLTCPLGEFPALSEYGFVDEPGRWDHWPSGFTLTWPNELQTNGTIVIDKGDILLPQKSYVSEPITLTIANGYATDIRGGVDAELLSTYMASFNDPEAYAMSHIGWGLQPRASWAQLGLYDREAHMGMDARAFEGNFLFSLGPNNEVGGKRTTACHIDIPLRGCTVTLDSVTVVENGRVLPLED